MTAMRFSSASHTIPIEQVHAILLGARNRGMDVPRMLQRAGITPALMQQPLSRVTQEQYAALVRALTRSTRDELWGLLEHPLPMGSFSQICHHLVHCRNLEEALHTGLRYYRLLLQDIRPRMRREGDMVTISFAMCSQPSAALDFASRTFCFFTYGLASWLVSRRVPIAAVLYRPQDRHRITEAGRLFDAPVRFDSQVLGIQFHSNWLSLPVVQSTQSLQEFLQHTPSNLLIKYRDRSTLRERIRHLLRKHMTTDMPSLEVVSAQLGMTPQTVRRHLLQEECGFQAIKDELRLDIAIGYLSNPDMTLGEIAAQLGFSEASTFHRAFKTGTGLAPGHYRQIRLQS